MDADRRVQYEVRGPLAFLTLNRPEKLNAIDQAMVDGLNGAMDRAESDEQVRLVVLKGEGRAFSAGFDLEEEYADQADGSDPVATEIQRDFDLIMRFWDSPKPTLASLHGLCLGGAFEIALACDLAVATDDCRLGAPEVKFGSAVVAMLLPWLCGPRRANEIILSGEDRLNAKKALEYGILNRVVGPDALEEATIQLALKVARNDVNAVRHARKAIKEGYDSVGFREALARGMQHCIEVEHNHSAEAEKFYEIVKSEGVAKAASWLDEKLKINELTG